MEVGALHEGAEVAWHKGRCVVKARDMPCLVRARILNMVFALWAYFHSQKIPMYLKS